VFSNRPEVVDFLERFMGEEVQCQMGSEPGSSRISPNINVGPDCYPNPILAEASEVLTTALGGEGAAGFDASDQMPPEVGSGSFWTEMVGYLEDGPNSLQDHLRRELAGGVAAQTEVEVGRERLPGAAPVPPNREGGDDER
jgi:alpha-glucoside transport system substrate-binding protein